MITHDVLIGRIRDVLNEHEGDTLLEIAPDRILLDTYINRAISDAVTAIAAKGFRINERNIKEEPVTFSEKKNIYNLPNDFISLIEVKLTGWKLPVTAVTNKDEPKFRIAMNEFTPPGVFSPICYREGKCLVCMPGGSDAEYINVNVAYNGQLNSDEREITAVVYMAAAFVMGYFENDNGKQRLSEIATNYLA
ncbi:MAG: hypothetical protein E7088_08650 [Bacteroidales bacterium]|nr:hypothetical protein [Bacteroidales bacterium]